MVQYACHPGVLDCCDANGSIDSLLRYIVANRRFCFIASLLVMPRPPSRTCGGWSCAHDRAPASPSALHYLVCESWRAAAFVDTMMAIDNATSTGLV